MVGKILGALLAVDAVLLAISAFAGKGWMINTQVAYISSAIVLGASMVSYARMVHSRIEAGAVPDDGLDTIDKLEDPHDLYGDDGSLEAEKEINSINDIKEVIKEEKSRPKVSHRSPLEVLRDSRASMSLYRLGAYVLLVFGFFYLNGNKLLQPFPYLIGLGMPVLVVVVMLMGNREAG